MIKGIGTDIAEIERIKKSIQNPSFCKRFFTENENLYFKQKNCLPQSIAGVFCVKEAVSKALGTGILGFSLKDIEVLHTELGKPYVVLHNNAAKLFEAVGAKNVHVSISHSNENAIAFAVIED